MIFSHLYGKPPISSGAYTIPYSCTFNGTDEYMIYNAGAINADTSPKIKTFSAWVKRSATGSNDDTILSGFFSGNLWYELTYTLANKLEFACVISGSYVVRYISTATFTDTSLWHHIHVLLDTTQEIQANRVIVSYDGSELTEWDTQIDPSQNTDVCYQTYGGGGGVPNSIGSLSTTINYFRGLLAEIIIIDGTAYNVSNFIVGGNPVDPDGLIFGNQGYLLDFETSGDMGNDVSGNNNDFTPTGIDASNQSMDTPTV